MSMDPAVGDLVRGDVLVEGKKILAIGPNLHAGGAEEIDARGRIVMPGFIDTHHHQFETALRSFLANGILINDGSGSPSADPTYYEYILLTFAPVYRPQDVYISELFGGLAQLDDGVTTVHDISQIHHSPQHSDAAIKALFDTGRRAAFGYFESAGGVAGNQYPNDAFRIKQQWFSSSDQLVHMIMGGEVYLGEPTYTPGLARSGASSACRSRRTSSRRSASARSWTISPRARAASTTTSGSDPTTCSST